ncbi:hypothetical protein DVQ29_22715, partial [Yersinia enterocolitica]|nr:hypothetical protein [Yersinia enterocolitica]
MSNATDWISAGCNVVMASAAVYAAWNAKDWLSPSIHEQGLPIARELIGLRVYPFSENISSSDYCSQIMNLMNALLNHEDKLYLDSTNETNTTISLLSMIRGDIHKAVNYIIDEKSKIYQNIDSVNFLGWGMNSEKRKILDNM